MISLSLEEKDFLKSIVNLSKRTRNMFFGNLVDKYLSNIDVHITDKKDVEYRFDEQYFIETKSLHEVTLKISWTFLRFIKLLKYLEENNYLNFYLEIEDPNDARFGGLLRNNSFIVYKIHDQEFKNLLINYSFKTIIIGQTLVDFVENDFKTKEQLRHEENIKIAERNLIIANASLDKAEIGISQSKKSVRRATIAIIISIILGLISIISSFYISYKQSNSETRFENKQFSSLNKVLMSIDSKLKNYNVHDTLNAKIVKGIKVKK